MRGFVERRGAAGTGVDAAGRHVLVVDAGIGGFGAFFAEDSELFYRERKERELVSRLRREWGCER